MIAMVLCILEKEILKKMKKKKWMWILTINAEWFMQLLI